MVAKKFQNPKGGLNAAGRKHFKKTEGSNLKRPVKSGTNPRRVSFAARFAGMKGPMKDSKGRPTRLLKLFKKINQSFTTFIYLLGCNYGN